MRDALSMMDRIAGFTNGQLTYAQTVEHLNILDADVYFRLSDILLSKDVGGALLALDHILQRGFEGDVILNGFAEHFRNLLLSKDGRMARLLDVPEDHKRIYFEKAQIIPADYILSALSILNDTEIGYRTALNKRLHIELCLIRLCYLNDMISPASQDAESKKRHESGDGVSNAPQALPVIPEAFAAVPEKPVTSPPVVPTLPPVAAPQYKAPPVQAPPQPQPVAQPQYSQVPVLPDTVAEPAPATYSHAAATTAPDIAKKPKLGRNYLQDIHTQIGQQTEETGEAMVLTPESVQQLFDDFKSYIRYELNQVPVAEQLNMMTIQHISANEVKVLCVSAVNHIYGNNQREVLLDFAKKENPHSRSPGNGAAG